MKKTLKYKKAIGILAIVLGGIRFVATLGAYGSLQTIQTAINDNTVKPELLDDAKKFVSLTNGYLPFILIALAGILLCGIILMSVEKNIPETEPRKKSWIINIVLLCISVIYGALDASYSFMVPTTLTEGNSSAIAFGSLAFLAVLIVYCCLGFGKVQSKNEIPAETTPTAEAK